MLSIIPTGVMAEEKTDLYGAAVNMGTESIQTSTTDGGYVFEDVEGGVSIIGYTGLGGDVEIPDTLDGKNVVSIGSWAFYGCSGLLSISISDRVTEIGVNAFSKCSGLTSITIPDNVSTIGDYAFNGCSGLKSLTIGNSVTTIGESAFESCSGLTNVTLPNSLTNLGDYAFCGCSGLTSIMIPESVTDIDHEAFERCSGLTSISVDVNNLNYSSKGGVLFDKAGTTLVKFPNGLTTYSMPDGVINIGNDAFAYCSGLTSISIPDSVMTIGYGAFWNCSGLTSITIPESVTTIDDKAFGDCPNLTIYGIIGSYAETYSNDNDIPFVGTLKEYLKIESFTSDKEYGQPVNTEINLTAVGSGGRKPYQFKFSYQLEGSITQIQDFSKANKARFKPTVAGDYILIVEVKDITGEYSATRFLDMKIIDESISDSGFVAFLGKDPNGTYYEYSAVDLNNAYLAYQINPALATAKMYQQFLTSQCKVVALKDQAKGYMDYTVTANACLMAQMKGETFDINTYFGSNEAKVFEENVTNVRIVDSQGAIL